MEADDKWKVFGLFERTERGGRVRYKTVGMLSLYEYFAWQVQENIVAEDPLEAPFSSMMRPRIRFVAAAARRCSFLALIPSLGSSFHLESPSRLYRTVVGRSNNAVRTRVPFFVLTAKCSSCHRTNDESWARS